MESNSSFGYGTNCGLENLVCGEHVQKVRVAESKQTRARVRPRARGRRGRCPERFRISSLPRRVDVCHRYRHRRHSIWVAARPLGTRRRNTRIPLRAERKAENQKKNPKNEPKKKKIRQRVTGQIRYIKPR